MEDKKPAATIKMNPIEPRIQLTNDNNHVKLLFSLLFYHNLVQYYNGNKQRNWGINTLI